MGLVSLAMTIILIVAQWKVFEKAGEKGWKSLIPIYNIYTMFIIAKNDGFIKLVGISSAMTVVLYASVLSIVGSIATSKTGLMIIGVVAVLLAIICIIYTFVIAYKMYADFAEAFGHSRAWGILLMIPIASTVAMCILAFGSDDYVWEKEEPIYNKVVLKTILCVVLSLVLCIAITVVIGIGGNALGSDNNEKTDIYNNSDILSTDELDITYDMYDGNNVLGDLESSEDGKQILDNIANSFFESTFDGQYDSTYDYEVNDNEMTIIVSMPDDTYQFLTEDINDCLDDSNMLLFNLSSIGVEIKESNSVKINFVVKQGDTEIYSRTYDAEADEISVNGDYYRTYESIFEFDTEEDYE